MLVLFSSDMKCRIFQNRKYNVMVLIVGNEMHAQSILPWRSRNGEIQ